MVQTPDQKAKGMCSEYTLTHEKIRTALYNVAYDRELPVGTSIVIANIQNKRRKKQ